MTKWTWNKILIHAALDFRNPLGHFLTNEFSYRCTCGQILHWYGAMDRREVRRKLDERQNKG
jgi:hypothetical protein